jgi:N6-L-threonylcarbamoyladenine synthase/protein kinase Bud32
MLESGYSTPIEASQVNPSYRADQVRVTWRRQESLQKTKQGGRLHPSSAQGAEAVVGLCNDTVVKRRVSKGYRARELDKRLISERTRAEARLIAASRRSGVQTPIIRDITADTITMELVEGTLLKYCLSDANTLEAGRMVGRLHSTGIVHGDLTTSNMIIRDGKCVLIDFGLSQVSSEIETRGVDIHVFFQTLGSMTDQVENLKSAFSGGYKETFSGAEEVIAREAEIERRGRYL